MMLQTPSQTVGPFFAYGLTPEQYGYPFEDLTNNVLIHDHKEVIKIAGHVFDGEGHVIPDAMIELYATDQGNKSFARYGTGTDPDGRFIFEVYKTPYYNVILFMRGQLIHHYSRLYFDDEIALNGNDETYLSIPPERRSTLLAIKRTDHYEYNIHMQGDLETVFFDI